MTEDEAKTKWCPFSRVVVASRDGKSGTRNRVVETDASGNVEAILVDGLVGAQCIGSACMAWRWQDRSYDTEQTDVSRGEPPAPDGEGWQAAANKFRSEGRWYRNWRRPRRDRAGLCGLAGAPA